MREDWGCPETWIADEAAEALAGRLIEASNAIYLYARELDDLSARVDESARALLFKQAETVLLAIDRLMAQHERAVQDGRLVAADA